MPRPKRAMRTVIRQAVIADAEAISSLNADVQALHAAGLPRRFKPPSPETFPASAVIALLAEPSNIVFIAEVDRKPVGYAYAEIVRRPESAFQHAYEMVYLHHISVHARHRMQGLGQALLQALRSAAQQRGIDLLATDVWTFNKAAGGFFRRSGFEPYNERLWMRV